MEEKETGEEMDYKSMYEQLVRENEQQRFTIVKLFNKIESIGSLTEKVRNIDVKSVPLIIAGCYALYTLVNICLDIMNYRRGR